MALVMKNLWLNISLGCLVILAVFACGRRTVPKPVAIEGDTTRKVTHSEMAIDTGSLHVTDVPPGTDPSIDLRPFHPMTKEDSIRKSKIQVYDSWPDSLHDARDRAARARYNRK